MIRSFFIFLLLLFGVKCLAFKPDSLYVKPFDNKFSIRLFSGLKELSFSINNGQKGTDQFKKIIYKPNNGLVVGVGFSVKNLLLNLSTKLPGTEQNTSNFGNTDITDYQLNLTLRFFHISFFHREYNGFYITNSSNVDPLYENSPNRILRPDIKYITKGFETIFSFNPKRYSLNASFKMTEHQTRNVWAGLVYANISSIQIAGDSSLVPYTLTPFFNSNEFMSKGEYYGGSIQPGVTYNYSIGKWFVNPMLFSGIGYLQKKIYIVGNGVDEFNDFFFRVSTRVNCGYNARWLFWGFLVEWNNSFIPDKNLSLKTSNLNVMMTAGFRF